MKGEQLYASQLIKRNIHDIIFNLVSISYIHYHEKFSMKLRLQLE